MTMLGDVQLNTEDLFFGANLTVDVNKVIISGDPIDDIYGTYLKCHERCFSSLT